MLDSNMFRTYNNDEDFFCSFPDWSEYMYFLYVHVSQYT